MPDEDYRHRSINDPLHGSMGFSELELRVIESRAFRRLRGIKQLGLAYNVYPTADYSRFTHSLGVCHLAGRVMRHLRGLPSSTVSPEEEKLTRLAALTHDIGHYPFSHAFEEAIKKHYKAQRTSDGETNLGGSRDKVTYKHEEVSERVLTLDPELMEVFRRYDVDVKDLARRFQRESVVEIGTQVVTSDFDVDRTDYLLRTAHFAGLPYGGVNLDYLIEVMSLGKVEGRWTVVMPMKALRALDHFLLARFFDYQQVAFHKTITGFEQALEEAIAYLLKQERLACRREDVDAMIGEGRWIGFDDEALIRFFVAEREVAKGVGGNEAQRFLRLAEVLLERRSPALIGEVEFMAAEGDDLARDFEARVASAASLIEHLGNVEGRLVQWTNDGMPLTKVGADKKGEERERQAADQLVYIRQKSGTIRPLIDEPRSIMRTTSAQKWYCLRFYALDASAAEVNGWQREAQTILADKFSGDVVSELVRP